ncbi:MAG: beta-phosphoglucomutase [Saprospiraceae bacterium]|jgi:beta-phosphoglucomutase
MPEIKACLFDLDGVICNTAKLHFLAWKRLANDLGFDISPEQNDVMKGLSRMEALERLLEWGKRNFTYAEKELLAQQKYEWYLENIQLLSQDDILPGVKELFDDLNQKGVKIILGTSSKHAKIILDLLQLSHYFDDIIDGNQLDNFKPDPEVYLKATSSAGCKASECIVFEDELDGITAGIAAGCYTVGVGNMKALKRANLMISSFDDMSFDEIIACL